MTFKRYEMKYLLTMEQKKAVLERMERYMKPDEYGRTTIRNLYFDTNTYRLIRHSLEKPVYKEKLRIPDPKPVAPGQNGNGNDGQNGNNGQNSPSAVKTGDETPTAMWAGIVVISGLALIGAVVFWFRKRKTR